MLSETAPDGEKTALYIAHYGPSYDIGIYLMVRVIYGT